MESQDLTDVRQDDRMEVNKIIGLTPMFVLIVIIILRVSWVLYRSAIGQKTRSSQQRRVCVGARTRQLSVQEPSIYVSPANLSPPPKYEAMAPPSYEEVVGVHYPGYQSQPITQPITHALSSQSTSSAEPNATASSTAPPPAVITVTTEQRRTSADVRS
ncbi:unnamed protein product [Diatraea saccharalis]|uniref:Uncharacterized protein n=1 Tax=Diatraea saccharalis TaxID=40085 RepID=A0A9P0C6V8_9NEOP|nr:unnamed protein product [Diatraea saccharalis]